MMYASSAPAVIPAPARTAGALSLGALMLSTAIGLALAWPVARESLLDAPRVGSAFAAVAASPTLAAAIRLQAEALSGETQEQIDAYDSAWMRERQAGSGPLIEGYLALPASAELRRILAASDGVVTHAILMDERGRNVAIAAPTSDFWQGDEAKFIRTFGSGPSAEHRSVPQYGQDGRTVVCWVSRTVADARTGRSIGAVALEVNAERAGKAFCGDDPAP
jgi:hypothetical protein